MKVVLILLLPLFCFAQNNYYPETQKVYVYNASINVKYILKILDSNYYEFFKYNKSKVEYDYGIISSFNDGEYILESSYNRNRFNFLIHSDKIFITEKGVFDSKINKILNKNHNMKVAPISEYDKVYDFNYITDTICSELSYFRLGRANLSIKEAQDYFVKQAKQNVPEYVGILKNYYCGPGYYTTYIGDQKIKWNNDLSDTSLNKISGTVLHESVHGFNRWEWDAISNQWTHWYSIGLGKNIQVKECEYYETRHFYPIIPKIVKDSVFRYQTYVGIKSNAMASNVSGIFGLLDEYTAYMSGARISLDLFKQANMNNDSINATNFLNSLASEIGAYYQFNLFIAYYLKYAKEKIPKSYNAAFENKNLRIAYTVATKEYKSIVDVFYSIINADTSLINEYVNYCISSRNEEKEYLEKEKSILEEFMVVDLVPEVYLKPKELVQNGSRK